MKIFETYKHNNTDEKVRQESNLTPTEKSGMIKILKRVKNKEIIVAGTDKSQKVCVMGVEE